MSKAIQYINSEFLNMARGLNYSVADFAPGTENDLFNSTGLVIWSGASENTVYDCPKVNHAFRALHDAKHLETGLGFNPEQEIEMGRIQAAEMASQCKSLMADLFYCEIAEQARHFQENGEFVTDQVAFTKKYLKI